MSALERVFHEEDAEALAFENHDSESYHRTQEAGVIVTRKTRYLYRVSLTDCDPEERSYHLVQYYYDEGRPFGRCTCRGFRFHEGECAHLWGVRQATHHGTVTPHRLRDAVEGAPRCPTCGEVPEEVDRFDV